MSYYKESFYDRVVKYYKTGLWTKEMVKTAVDNEQLTKDHYKQITGEDYPVME